MKKPVNLSGVITRVNEFIGRVKPFLAAPVAVPSAPSTGTSVGKVQAAAATAVAAATCPPSGPVLAHALPPVAGDELPESATKEAQVGELTLEQAESARDKCTKCRKFGCSTCMGHWFIPRKLLKKWVSDSQKS